MTGLPRYALALLVFGAGCARDVDLDEVPVGTDVQVTRDDGAFVEGTLAGKSEDDVTLDVGPVTKVLPKNDIADIRVVDEDTPPEPPPMAKFRELTVPAGTELGVELATTVTSETARINDPVSARLARSIVVDGIEVLPEGSVVHGRVSSVQPAGKVKGRASLALEFTGVEAHDERYPIEARLQIVAPATKGEDARKIGIPAAGGAVIGAILGGKKGAAVGAAIGGGAGTAAVLMTPGDDVTIRSGAEFLVSMASAMDVRVPITR